jgi:PAS domain S-box-containing protein
MPRILFLGRQNAALSRMAEAFAAVRMAGAEVASAGVEAAAPLHPMVARVMAEVGIDMSSRPSRTLNDFDPPDFDLVVAVTHGAAALCPLLPGHPQTVDWNMNDPSAVAGDEATVLRVFREARDEVRRCVDDLVGKGYLAALLTSRYCSSLILDHVSDGIMAHDMDRRIFHFNRAAERITGYRREEVMFKDCREVFPDGLCGGHCRFLDPGRPAIPAPAREFDIRTRSGENRRVSLQLTQLDNEGGEPAGVVALFRDLTHERQLERRVRDIEQFAGIVGKDEKMLEIFDLIHDLVDTDVPVMIEGESGTGKELIAAAIHNEGNRANRLFVPVNCGALPEGLLESELFGHVKGSFTGAIRDKKGRFELADGGTIFLDEIGDISQAMQVKLLRVLQDGAFERVGSEQTLQVNVRVISATNKDLKREIEEGRFREDLYYRLNVVPVRVPPLRERRIDIPLIIAHTLKQILERSGREGVSIAPETLDIMMSYDWPGNVRELQNWLQFALVKCRGALIRPEHLPPASGVRGTVTRRRHRKKLDAESVRTALEQADGNKVEAARLLGVSRATLYRFFDDGGRPV